MTSLKFPVYVMLCELTRSHLIELPMTTSLKGTCNTPYEIQSMKF